MSRAAALEWQTVLEAFWRDFKPKTAEVMEQQAARDHRRRSTSSSRPGCFPPRPTAPIRGCARTAATGGCRCAAAGSARSSPAPIIPNANITRRFGQGGGEAASDAAGRRSARDPDNGRGDRRKTGRFGPYVQLGDGKEAKRASIPKDVPASSTSSWRCSLLSLPREIGAASRERQADHRLDRPLRPLSRA